MLPSVQYTALRSLYGGVASGTVVTLELPVRYAGMPVAKKTYGSTRVSMAGSRERYHERTERIYSITTKPIPEDLAARLRMFLDSVDESEAFQFSPNTSAFAAAYLDDLDYSEQLEQARDSLRIFSFSIVVP